MQYCREPICADMGLVPFHSILFEQPAGFRPVCADAPDFLRCLVIRYRFLEGPALGLGDQLQILLQSLFGCLRVDLTVASQIF